MRGSEQAGQRPVLIVSRDAINRNSSVVIGVPFTDAANCSRIYPSQILLRKGVGGLTLDSVALCEQVRAISVSRLGVRLGSVNPQVLKAVDEKLKIALDLE